MAERQYTGTGFVLAERRIVVTNRHVALPWENDASSAALAERGLVYPCGRTRTDIERAQSAPNEGDHETERHRADQDRRARAACGVPRQRGAQLLRRSPAVVWLELETSGFDDRTLTALTIDTTGIEPDKLWNYGVGTLQVYAPVRLPPAAVMPKKA